MNKILYNIESGTSGSLKTVPLSGYRYNVDLQQQAVFNMKGHRMKEQNTRTCTSYALRRNDGKKCTVSKNRVMFAALNGISPDLIPKDVVVVNEDGAYHLINRSNHLAQVRRQNFLMPIEEWRQALERRNRETEILLRYAETGNHSELVEYLLSQHNRIVLYTRVKYQCRRQKAHDVVSQVIEKYIDKAIHHQIRTMTITPTLYWQIHDVYCNRKREVMYIDNRKV